MMTDELTADQKLFEATKRILAAKGLNVVEGRFVVSASRPGIFHLVILEAGTYSCPDFHNRGAVTGVPCKHFVAVREATKQAARKGDVFSIDKACRPR